MVGGVGRNEKLLWNFIVLEIRMLRLRLYK